MSKGVRFKNKNNEPIYPCPYFPIGSIYLSITNINPSTYFGGRWELIKDRFLLGAGGSYSVNNKGGATTTTIMQENLPDRVMVRTNNTTGFSNHFLYDAGLIFGKAINNMPPYRSRCKGKVHRE